MTMTSLKAAPMAALLLALAGAPALADHAAAKAHSHDHDAEAEAKADKTVSKGYFEDSQIAPRNLTDWEGSWQSVFPLLVGGKLDAVMAHKAQKGDKTAAEYADYYRIGYATDVDGLIIDGDTVTFQRKGKAVTGRYVSDGFEILTYEKGNRGVRFIFKKAEGDAEAPQFIQFSDHKIAPEAADHYHLYWGDDRAKVLKELTNWPTYYPAALTPDEVVAEMTAH